MNAAGTSQIANIEHDDNGNTLDSRIVQVVCDDDGYAVQDGDGNFIVMVIPGLVPNVEGAWEQSLRMFLRETEEVSFCE